ncbi:lactonase family protein [Planctomicrobium sp. SH664]|uniref:lactonase family protein n=1 Tax=Planctomicrobium sp. SH664 TaxID=3448125 RepID=UPI003F5B325B
MSLLEAFNFVGRWPFIMGSLLMGLIGDSPLYAGDATLIVATFAPGEAGGIEHCRFDEETGAIQGVGRTTGIEHVFYMAVSPDGRFLYATHAPGKFGGSTPEFVAAYRRDPQTGALTLLNQQSTGGTASCFLEVDATGGVLLLANYASATVASLPIREDGSLEPIASLLTHTGSGTDPVRQAKPHPHCIVRSPDNRFAFVADLGLDQIIGYPLEARTGKLLSTRPQITRTFPGAGPRHLRFHPDGEHLIVINELAGSITLFDYDSESGRMSEVQTLSTLPEGFSGKSLCADLRITPDGRFLYATNRGHDSIAAFRILPDATLQLVSIVPSQGEGPQNLGISPNGKWLLCANMPGNSVSVFQIDPETGELALHGSPVSFPKPPCLILVQE